MRPLIAAEPMLRAPSPEIVSESTLMAGVCALETAAIERYADTTTKQRGRFIFMVRIPDRWSYEARFKVYFSFLVVAVTGMAKRESARSTLASINSYTVFALP